MLLPPEASARRMCVVFTLWPVRGTCRNRICYLSTPRSSRKTDVRPALPILTTTVSSYMFCNKYPVYRMN